jgi:hypothetical protein
MAQIKIDKILYFLNLLNTKFIRSSYIVALFINYNKIVHKTSRKFREILINSNISLKKSKLSKKSIKFFKNLIFLKTYRTSQNPSKFSKILNLLKFKNCHKKFSEDSKFHLKFKNFQKL